MPNLITEKAVTFGLVDSNFKNKLVIAECG